MRIRGFAGLVALAAVLAGPMLADPVAAEGRQTLGVGRLLSNDYFGDGKDRWQTGSFSLSIVRGSDWSGRAPARPFEILEYRLGGQVIAPRSLAGAGSDDRPYVGALSAGVHTHFARGDYDLSLGVDVTAVGPQTGLGDFQEWLHEVVSAPSPDVVDDQLGNEMFLGATAEISRKFSVNNRLHLRPFAQVTTGPEDLARVGFDVIVGRVASQDLALRDVVTGHLYRGIEGPDTGLSLVFGSDYTRVWDSAWLPEDRGVTFEENRTRLRAGLHWQLSRDITVFYGATYLSEEFEGQNEGQVLGSLKLDFRF